MNNFILAEKIQGKMFPLFDYVHDIKQYMVNEHWTSHAWKVNEGKTFRDDCDGYACTAAELLVDAGVSKSDISLVYCETETGEAHLVCGVYAKNSTYILENRYTEMYDWEKREGYKWLYFMPLDSPGTWSKVTNG